MSPGKEFGADRAELSPQQAVFGGLETFDVVPPGREGVECAHAAVGLGTGGEKPAGAAGEVRGMVRELGRAQERAAAMNPAADISGSPCRNAATAW
ncbi:hypothetical protein [Streptomyces sp. NPDC001340]